MNKITPCLWFDDQAEDAAKFYTSIFSARPGQDPDSERKDSKIKSTAYYGEATKEVTDKAPGSIMTVEFELEGQKFIALNGGPEFKFNEAISFVINCGDQEEVDYFWEKLTEGGKEVQCGWLKDKFGVSWQVTPTILNELLSSPNKVRAEKVMQAMLKMKKIEIPLLRQAYEE